MEVTNTDLKTFSDDDDDNDDDYIIIIMTIQHKVAYYIFFYPEYYRVCSTCGIKTQLPKFEKHSKQLRARARRLPTLYSHPDPPVRPPARSFG